MESLASDDVAGEQGWTSNLCLRSASNLHKVPSLTQYTHKDNKSAPQSLGGLICRPDLLGCLGFGQCLGRAHGLENVTLATTMTWSMPQMVLRGRTSILRSLVARRGWRVDGQGQHPEVSHEPLLGSERDVYPLQTIESLLWDNLLWDNLLWHNILWDNIRWDNLLWHFLL
ncbi:hypothetical protein LA080_013919 [Diaporthe eres]|nr:hypothetical protein LA080_013919 [Diaporthe eres]